MATFTGVVTIRGGSPIVIPETGSITPQTQAALSGREPIAFVELDLDYCGNTFGTSPCTAVVSDKPNPGEKCYNTRNTCKDSANYAQGLKTYRFCEQINIPPSVAAWPSARNIKTAPTEIDPGGSLGRRASVTATLQDFAHHDRGVDPYIDDRSAEAQGTFFGRLKRRNQYYDGRPMRIRTGYITTPWDWSNFETRHYIIERIEGPDNNGRVKVVGKDLLKLADKDRVKVPAPSTGALQDAQAAGDTLLVLELGGEDDYPATGGTVRINDELITYTSRTGTILSGCTRGTNGTTAEDHEAGDSVQLCVVFSDQNAIDIIKTLLIDYASIPAARIDSGNWDAHRDLWFASAITSRVLSEPTGVSDLVSEIIEQFGLRIWWDERAQLVRLGSLHPPTPTEDSIQINDESHIVSLSVSEKPDERITRVVIYYGKRNQTAEQKPEHYNAYVRVLSDEENVDLYGDTKTKTIYADWLTDANYGQVIVTAKALLNKYGYENPRYLTFDIDAKDAPLFWVGDMVDISTDQIQDWDGSSRVMRWEIISANETQTGHTYTYKAQIVGQADGLRRRFAWIGPNSLPNYTAASPAERNQYGFWADNNGELSDSADDADAYPDDGYSIL